MLRTQIQLTEEQARLLRAAARREHVSVAEIIRRCVDASLGETEQTREELYARAASLVGAFADREDAADVSIAHDRYLDEDSG